MAMAWSLTRMRSAGDAGPRTIRTNLHKDAIHAVGVRRDLIDVEGTPYRMMLAVIGDEAEVETTTMADVTWTGGGDDRLGSASATPAFHRSR